MNTPVVVAYDQTPYSKLALAEGVREAVSRGTGLRVVHAYATAERLPMGPFATVLPTSNVELTNRRDAEEILDEVAGEVRAGHPALAVETRAVPGDPAAAILAEAADAALLVVGSRGRGGFAGLLLGSTSHRVLADARCPVVVVHDAPSAAEGRVLVGVDLDGPRGAADALLEFAFATATARGLRLVAANVWTEPWTIAYTASHGDADGLAYEQQRADRMTELLDPWQAKYPEVDVVVRLFAGLTSGTAGNCLVEASRSADLVVVGAHAEPGRRHANRLGPVAQTLLHHAYCPVGVVASQDTC